MSRKNKKDLTSEEREVVEDLVARFYDQLANPKSKSKSKNEAAPIQTTQNSPEEESDEKKVNDTKLKGAMGEAFSILVGTGEQNRKVLRDKADYSLKDRDQYLGGVIADFINRKYPDIVPPKLGSILQNPENKAASLQRTNKNPGKANNKKNANSSNVDIAGLEEGMDSYGVFSSRPYVSFVARCYHCMGPRTVYRPLKRCSGCQLVYYCSKICQKENFYLHKYFCKEFKLVDGKNCLYHEGPWEEHLAQLKVRAERVQLREDWLRKSIFATPRVCHTCHEPNLEFLEDCSGCASVAYCSRRCARNDKKHIKECSEINRREKKISLHYTLVSYSQSVKNVISHFKSVMRITSLNVHIVSSCPGTLLDLEQWEEIVMHSTPKLVHFNIVFVIQNKRYKPSKATIAKNNKSICHECKAMNRSITYSIRKMPYHMYYSSDDYIEADYVFIFGNSREMAANPDELKENLNSDISYRNMLSNPKTYVVLYDETLELVEQGITTMKALDIPLSTVISPRVNEYRAFSSIRGELGLADEGYNDRQFFTMVRKSDPSIPIPRLMM